MYKILIVDDEPDVCDFVKHFFEERDYDVATASNGEEAVRAAKKQKFDVILMDVRMRKMDGIEALRKIREFDKITDIIMVTAVDDKERIGEATRLGARKYITKPLILEDLESAVYEITSSLKKDTAKGEPA